MRLEKESGGKQAGDENPEKKLKDEGDHDDGPQAKKLKDEGGGPQAQMPCNVIQFCQTRNWIFDLDRTKLKCSNCHNNLQNEFSLEIV